MVTISVDYTFAGSPSSGDIPPEGGSDDTSGGSASGGLYLNYRIPLVLKTGPFAPTLITINTFYDGVPIIFDFKSVVYGNDTILYANETLVLNPLLEPNLTNGSLIQTFAPLQINVYHPFSNSSYDDSFSYSALVMSMWGKKYQSQYDNMKAMIVAGVNSTDVSVTHPGEDVDYYDLPIVGSLLELDVQRGTIIEANAPIGVVFYSLSTTEGSFAYTAIPHFLWGTVYYAYPAQDIGAIPLLQGDTELTVSTIGEGATIVNTETNYLNNPYENLDENGVLTLSNGVLTPGEYYSNISSSFYVNISLTIMYNYSIDGNKHLATLQYIASEKMTYAEFYFTELNYKNQELGIITHRDESWMLPMVSMDNGTIFFDLGGYVDTNLGDSVTYVWNNSIGIIGNGSFHGFLVTSPPEAANWNSSANNLYPLNLISYFENTSTFFPSWYRFPNINVREVIVSPTNPTEFRRLQLDIIVQNNGSVPAAPFWVSVAVNDTVRINRNLENGLDIMEAIPIIFEEFQGFGLKVWNISIFTDSQSQIFELYEFDNSYQLFIEVTRNWNIVYGGIAIAVVVVGFVVYRITKRILKLRKRSKTQFDVILSDIEV
jgi:hypothetical protein